MTPVFPLDLLRRSGSWWFGSAVAAALLAVTVFQLVHFVDVYRTRGPARTIAFEAGVAPLLGQAFATGATLYVDHDDAYALTHARWYAIDHHLPETRVVRLPDGGVPPNGSTVFGRLQGCDYRCDITGRSQDYFVARAVVPASS